MKSAFLAIVLGLFSACFISCASSGSGSSRTLAHSYQDSRGLTIITLFDMGNVVGGSRRTIGDGSSPRRFVLPRDEFERLWSQLDEAEISRFAIQDDSQRFDAQNNYVIIKGTMPGGNTTTYAIPKSQASPKVKSWVKSFRTETRS